ncbi:acetylajmalan esterase-like [Coffea eugenioides]|uniref:acetylajmalan esterase-like n=1 Tax=Coffea eugenioides TaxID=49369 RepID=UPI000F610A9A|nr:acetylajmalan esterase-like [Coffea eugenioides]XP_027160236.1 acetylajmalan esterase-like [Coffea eugenioides]XP_027160237.1 acetylajmalan esterase-like [Coffea eugenioides]XP_027160238.1 acetylajmalan esterase-like [Coffea eugenioides]XP_027160239.1 acetylajmalan esterase-like [Coffea eugenioides]
MDGSHVWTPSDGNGQNGKKTFWSYCVICCILLIYTSSEKIGIFMNSRKLGNYSFKIAADNIGTVRPLEKACHFNKIYQLGDSIADTGNLVRESPFGSGYPFAHLPYGETTFGFPTGRCSDGLLMIDYIALASGLPYLEPSMKEDGNFTAGVNFAVAGSTALPKEVLEAKDITNPISNSSLSVQLDWMSSHFASICHTKEGCRKMLEKSLFFVGEIGGNDYNVPFLEGRSMNELTSLVPEVVQSITNAIKRVIDFGATRIIVPGNFPIGCIPVYLAYFQTNDTAAYDEHHCLKDLNNFAEIHNQLLKASIKKLKKDYPKVVIVYGDYYNAYLSLLSNARSLGFDENSLQKACCGTEPYDCSSGKFCGTPGVKACPRPDKYISWDGVHSTQQAYKYMTAYLLDSIIPQLKCHSSALDARMNNQAVF